MLTATDFKKLIAVLKEVFATKEDLEESVENIRGDFRVLQTSVDKFARKMGIHDDEIKVLNHRVTKLERK